MSKQIENDYASYMKFLSKEYSDLSINEWESLTTSCSEDMATLLKQLISENPKCFTCQSRDDPLTITLSISGKKEKVCGECYKYWFYN